MATPVRSPDPLDELTACAEQLDRLHYDNRDPSAFHLGKIDVVRGIQRAVRRLRRG